MPAENYQPDLKYGFKILPSNLSQAIGGGGVNFFVAASNASDEIQERADYVCDGVNDNVEINAAIGALPTAGGSVTLSEGTFYIGDEIDISASFIELTGQGQSTTLFQQDNADLQAVIRVTGTGTINAHVKNLYINGNEDDNAFGSGIYVNTPWQNGKFDPNHVFEDILIESTKNNGFEVAASSDTRVLHLTRVRVRGAGGNGFYMPAPSSTDNIFTDCIAEVCALNGFYMGCLNSHFINCKAFYNGSAGGNNHGLYIAGYNNVFVSFQSQDNYQSGIYSQNDGDATYGAQNNVLIGCTGDSNNQSANASYGCGLQIHNCSGWQIIGGQYYTRPYPDFTQRIGILLSGTTTNTVISGAYVANNSSAQISDTSSGTNYVIGVDGVASRLQGSLRLGLELRLPDGQTAPSTISGVASIYVDTADGDLKVKFADGTVKTLATDT